MKFDSWRDSRGGRIAAAVSSGAAARVTSALITLVSLPLVVRYLGAERFGIWATISSTVVFLNLTDLGIASTLTNHLARSYATRDREYAARYTTNALVLSLAVAGVVLVFMGAAWPLIDWPKLLNVPPSLPPGELSTTVAVAVLLVLLGLPASLVTKILAGYQEVHRANMIVAVATVANFVGLLAGIALRASMSVLFLLVMGWTTLINLATLALTVFWHKPWLRPRIAFLKWQYARELLGSGSGFFLIQIAGAVVFSSDNVVLSHYLGPAQVTPYNVTWRLVGLAAAMQGLLLPALWPAYAEAHTHGDFRWMRRAFGLTIRATLVLNVIFGVLLLAAGQTLIRWWAGTAAVPSITLLAAMGLWAVISGCMTAESCLLAAVNRTREQGVLSVVAAALNLALSILLVQRVGAVGVIAGTILSYLLVLVVPQTLLVRAALVQPSTPDGKSSITQGAIAGCR